MGLFRSLAILALGLSAAAYAAVVDQELDEGIADTGLDTGPWTAGQVPPLEDMITVNDFQIAAKNALSGRNYAYYRTAALDETTPAASAGRAHPGAEANLVRAAGKAGILYAPSISSTLSIEEIAAAAQEGQVMFHQEYIWANETQLRDELGRMEASGFRALFLTVDNTGINGVRDRSLRFGGGGETAHSSTFTIEALARLRTLTDLPIVPKGVKTAHDVKVCADLGFPAVYLSNHGGRQVDGVPTAAEILLDLHRQHPEVFGQIEIYADGGVRRGTHVLALLALGARAVGLGRPPMFANVFGQDGVDRLLAVLRQELETEMKLMGQADIAAWFGNTTFLNTRQLELEYFGAPLDVPTSSDPFVHSSPPAGGVARRAAMYMDMS